MSNLKQSKDSFQSFDVKKMDLNDAKYEADDSTISKECKCFTCNNKYTKAYIHHLLKCHELNANILIIMYDN